MGRHRPPDIDASVAFYGGLFGWEYAPAGPPEETGDYGMFSLRDKLVAGIGPLQDPTQPPVWSTYVTVNDATVARAADAGGWRRPNDAAGVARIAMIRTRACSRSSRPAGLISGASRRTP